MKAKYEVPITEIDGGKNGTAETVEFNNLFPNA